MGLVKARALHSHIIDTPYSNMNLYCNITYILLSLSRLQLMYIAKHISALPDTINY